VDICRTGDFEDALRREASKPFSELWNVTRSTRRAKTSVGPTIGTQAVLVTSSNQPDELCYAVVKAVIENFADFRRLHPALSSLEIKDMVPSGSIIPIHPGALNYYREAGLVH